MPIETTVLDFKLSNTFEEYETHMNAPEQQAMFKEMGIKTFYIGKSIEDPKRIAYSPTKTPIICTACNIS